MLDRFHFLRNLRVWLRAFLQAALCSSLLFNAAFLRLNRFYWNGSMFALSIFFLPVRQPRSGSGKLNSCLREFNTFERFAVTRNCFRQCLIILRRWAIISRLKSHAKSRFPLPRSQWFKALERTAPKTRCSFPSVLIMLNPRCIVSSWSQASVNISFNRTPLILIERVECVAPRTTRKQRRCRIKRQADKSKWFRQRLKHCKDGAMLFDAIEHINCSMNNQLRMKINPTRLEWIQSDCWKIQSRFSSS